ncbi:MAG: CHASE domain-containing protein, partial [Gammaproteobacteria bacterium]|nr:CHASE domain-containing protein [Gammaproteobacteria bacterium]
MSSKTPNLKTILSNNAPTILAIVIGSLIGIVFYYLILKTEQAKTRENFQNNALDKISDVIRVIEQNVTVPLSLASLFAASNDVTPDEFDVFTQPLLKQYQSLQALQWAPVVSNNDKASFEITARHYFKDFTITQRSSHYKMVPALKRNEYVPVLYTAPLKGNEKAHGFDLASNRDRKSMLEHSRDTGRTSISSRIRLVQDAEHKSSVLVSHPVYNHREHSLTSLAKRKRAIKGYAIAVIRIEDAIISTINKLHDKEIELFIIDTTDINNQQVIFGHNQALTDTENIRIIEEHTQSTEFVADKIYRLHNRSWKFYAVPSANTSIVYRTWLPWLAMILIMCITLTTGLYLKLLIIKDTRFKLLLEDKNNEIRHRKQTEKTLNKVNKRLEVLSYEDSLMRIYNRRKYEFYIEREWLRAIRSSFPLSLIILDVDNFKLYNDYYGH